MICKARSPRKTSKFRPLLNSFTTRRIFEAGVDGFIFGRKLARSTAPLIETKQPCRPFRSRTARLGCRASRLAKRPDVAAKAVTGRCVSTYARGTCECSRQSATVLSRAWIMKTRRRPCDHAFNRSQDGYMLNRDRCINYPFARSDLSALRNWAGSYPPGPPLRMIAK